MLSSLPSAAKPARPAVSLADTRSLYLYSDSEDKLLALRDKCLALDARCEYALLPGCGSKRRWCLALAFSTAFLTAASEGGAAAASAQCPEAMLREEVCQRAGCGLSPAQVVAVSKGVIEAIQRECSDLDTEATVPAHHEPTFAAATGDAWALLSMDDALVQRLRAYHGEEVGGYFLYLTSYQHWLMAAALVGALLFFLPLGSSQGARVKDLLALALPPAASPTYAFLLPCWMVFALKMWSWKQEKIKAAWAPPRPRPAAASAAAASPAPGSSAHAAAGAGTPAASHAGGAPPAPALHLARAAPHAHREAPWGATEGVKLLLLAPPLALYAGLSFLLYRQCEAIGEALGSPLLDGILQLLVHYIFAEWAAEAVAEMSADFVTGRGGRGGGHAAGGGGKHSPGHAPHADSRTHESLQLRIGLLLSQLILQAPFIHMAFVERDMAGVRERLVYFLGVKSFILFPLQQLCMPWLQTNVLPHLSYAWVVGQASALMARRRPAAPAAAAAAEGSTGAGSGSTSNPPLKSDSTCAANGSAPAPPASHPPLPPSQLAALHALADQAADMPLFEADAEHQQLFTQLALIATWGAVFPLAPLFCLLSNLLELWVDSAKLLQMRRCIGGEDREGLLEREAKWSSALKGIAYVACAMNAGLMIASEAGAAAAPHGAHGGGAHGGAHGGAGASASGSGSGGWGAATQSSVLWAFALEHAAFAVMMAVEIALPEHYFLALTAAPKAVGARKRAAHTD